MTAPRSISSPRLFVFAAGDFAFNLYWQSVSLYLLFFYIDVLRLPPALAGTIFLVGALWDGIADLAAGAIVERTGLSCRRLIGWGALPLGAAFVLMFAQPVRSVAGLIVVQMLFRTLYAATNIPYAAWTTRLSDRSAVRTLLTGSRMMFGAGAAALVALGLPALAERGAATPTAGYAGAAMLLALAATPLLLLVAWIVPEAARPVPPRRIALRGQMAALAGNRAFLLLNLAAVAGGAAAMLLTQSIPYHFRYVVQDAYRGPQTLAAMGLASTIALPVWTLLARRIGARAAWLVAILLALACLAVLAVSPPGGIVPIVALAVAFAGFGLAGWSLLPDSIDWGAAQGGPRGETLAFGVFAFLQKVALAGAGLLIGVLYQANGFVAGAVQTGAAIGAIRWLMLGGPALLVALCGLAVLLQPLRRETPAAIRRA
jgi:GPH family glycoside/pentoside/hexuronide:cation symporter